MDIAVSLKCLTPDGTQKAGRRKRRTSSYRTYGALTSLGMAEVFWRWRRC
jgi:hypothetical protein